MKGKLYIESFFVTVLVYLVIWALFLLVNISFEPFNYVFKSVKDIDLNDLYFSNIDVNDVDTNIIIVNIEDVNRGKIAEVLEKVGEAKPAVIGLDVFFSNYIQTPFDSILKDQIIKQKDNLVMVANFDDNGNYDENYWQLDNVDYGHALILSSEDKTASVREFEPKTNSDVYSFSARIARKFDRKLFDKLVSRNNPTERIDYIGGAGAFMMLNYRDILNMDNYMLDLLSNKIVLIGYCGDSTQQMVNYYDAFYTPVGQSMSVNRLPDMYGVMVHANIVSMIIRESYFNNTPGWIVFVISFIIAYFTVVAFSYFYLRKPMYFNVVSKVLQLLGIFVLLWMVFLLFSMFNLNFKTSYLIVAIILSVDVLFLYEYIAILVYKKFGVKSIFIVENPKVE